MPDKRIRKTTTFKKKSKNPALQVNSRKINTGMTHLNNDVNINEICHNIKTMMPKTSLLRNKILKKEGMDYRRNLEYNWEMKGAQKSKKQHGI